ncbi:MAG: TetR/AcrR family transcriptional regulator [Ruminococcus sp.]|nr:TetR/AcrR family transcriptional regulator [Ruminococcus sp.]
MKTEISEGSLKSRRLDRAVSMTAELFLKKGIEDVKMTDIAQATGIGVATLYRYFGTKTGITIAAMTHLWNKLRDMFSGVFESEVFCRQTGLKQVTDLMRTYVVLYTAHKDFLRLLGEFDLFIIHEKVSVKELEDYDKSIINFYPIFEKSFKAGIEDGTIRERVDCRLFYTTFAHSLMELGKKLVLGELLPSDNFRSAEKELALIVECASSYLRKE